MAQMRVLLSVVLLLGALAPAAAQDAAEPSDEARAAARAAYGEGEQALSDGRFGDAEEAFTRAYAQVPNPVVLLGVAAAQERGGNVAGAARSLQLYLQEREDAPDRAEVQTRYEALAAQTGSLTIASTPAGASVWVDGEEKGTTPLTLTLLAPGSYALVLRLEGHEDAELTSEVAQGANEAVVTLSEVPPPAPEPNELLGDGEPMEEVEAEEPAASSDDDGPGVGVWIAAGVAAAGLVTGTVLGFAALSEESDFNEMPTAESADNGERLATFADVAFGVAAAGAVTAVVLFLTRDTGDDEDDSDDVAVNVMPLVGPQGGGVSAQVQF